MDSGSGWASSEEINVEMVGSTVQVNRRSTIMKRLQIAIDTVTWNKKQCERILHRCNAIVESRLGFVALNSASDSPEASDADLVYRKFHQILDTVLKLVEGYNVAEGKINSLVVARVGSSHTLYQVVQNEQMMYCKNCSCYIHEAHPQAHLTSYV